MGSAVLAGVFQRKRGPQDPAEFRRGSHDKRQALAAAVRLE